MDWKLVTVLFIVAAILYIAYLFFSQRQVALLSILLYQKQDYQAYYSNLESLTSKLFFSKKLRSLMKLDAVLMEDDSEKVKELLPVVDQYRLRPVERLIVTAKEFSYFTRHQDNGTAKKYIMVAKETFEELTEKQKKQYEPLLEELVMSSSLIMDKSGKYSKDLEKVAKSKQDPATAGVFFLKAALANHYRNETDLAIENLTMANEKLKITTYSSRVQSILEKRDWKDLEEVVIELS